MSEFHPAVELATTPIEVGQRCYNPSYADIRPCGWFAEKNPNTLLMDTSARCQNPNIQKMVSADVVQRMVECPFYKEA